MEVFNNAMKQIIDLKNNTVRPMQIDFIKHLVSVSVILIPLLSFVQSSLSDDINVFHGLLCSLSVCILMGTIHLYIVLAQHRKMAQDLASEVKRMIRDNDRKQSPIFGKYNRIMTLTERLCVLSFFFSVGFIVYLAW